MRTRFMSLIVLGMMVAVVGPARAESDTCGCPIQSAMQKLPSLTFMVGQETTSCKEHASELAEKGNASIRYAVEQSYDNQSDATLAMVAATEALVHEFATSTKCEVTGITSIAGKQLQCCDAAAKTAARVKEAIDTVQVSYKVGDKQCDCPVKAGKLSAELGKDVVFVVNGEETCCAITGRLNQARAKYDAAVKTVYASAKTASDAAENGQCSACPIQAAMQKLPSLVFRVGSESTACDKHAAELAKKSDAPITYVVRHVYDCETAANLSLADATEAFVDGFATSTPCEATGTTQVAGRKLTCSETAAKTAQLVKDAMNTVSVSYKVGNKTCDCPAEASELAENSGAKLIHVVNGEETSCPVTSRLNLARAKYRAALEALANADG